MAPRTVYANLPDGLANLNLWDQSLADMGSIGVIPCTAAGTNAIVLTPIASLFPPNINNPPNANQMFSFVATATSTGAVTVQIAGVTSFLKLYRMDAATQAASGDVLINVTYVVSFGSALNSNAGGFQIQSPISNEINPIISGATITNSTYNGNTWTTGTGTLTINGSKTLTLNNTLTFSGTDGKSLVLTNGLAVSGNDGTLSFGAVSKTLAVNNSLTLAGTDATTLTFQGTDTYVGRATTDTLTNKTIDTAGPNTIKVNGNTLSATAGTATVTVQNSTDTLVGRATTDTLTNKTIDTAGPNTIKVGGVTVSAGQYAGTATNDSATAGNIGELITSIVLVGSAVNLTTGTPANVTSISLTAGDWDVWGDVWTNPGGSTTTTLVEAWVSTTSATLPSVPAVNTSRSLVWTSTPAGGANSIPVVPCQISLASTTTVFLGTNCTFAASTLAGYGALYARRRR